MQFYRESPLAARCWVTSLLRACERVRGSEGADLRGRPWWGRRTGGRGQGQEMTAALWPPSGRLGTGSTFGRCRQLHSTGGHPTAAAPATQARGQDTENVPPTRAESLALPQPQGRGPFWGSSAHSCLRSAEPAPPLTQLPPWPRLLPRRWRERQQDTGLRASGRGGHGHVAPAAARPSPARAHAGGGRGSARTASLPRCQPRPVQRKLITQVKF